MKRTRNALLPLVAAGVLVAAGCGGSKSLDGSSGGSGNVPSNAVAVVAGATVTRAELNDLLDVVELTYKQNNQQFPKAGTPEYTALQQQAAVYLVTQEEYAQEAHRRGIDVSDADVDTSIDALIKSRFGGDRKKWDAYLKSSGYTLPQFRELQRRQLIQEGLRKAIVKGIAVTDAAAKAYYEKNKKSLYTTPAQRRVRHILIALNAKGVGVSEKNVTSTTVDFAKSKPLADKVYAQLTAGGDFAKLAKQYSQDPGSKDKGGEYTDVKGTFVAEFEKFAFAAKTKQISKPIKSQFGYHIIQTLGPIQPGRTKTFAEVRKEIRSTLLQQKQNDALRTWAAGLGKRYKGKISYAAGFTPPSPTSTGTSGTTTAP
jgi:parvulin-like peptidyl-prolyl isomerase